MAAVGDVTKVFRNPCQLIAAPANTTTPPLYGGTPLGRIRKGRHRWGFSYENVRDEAWGEVLERHRVTAVPFFACFMEEWNDATFALGFPSVDQSASPARIQEQDVASNPGVVPAMNSLLVASIDPQGECAYIRRPVLCLEEQAETAFMIEELGIFPLVFYATRDSAYASIAPVQVAPAWRLVL